MDGCSHITSTFACPVSDEQQVEGAPAEDLIGDVPVLALGVPSFGRGRGPQRRRMPACVTDGRVGTSSALGFRPNHHSPSGATFFPPHQPRLVKVVKQRDRLLSGQLFNEADMTRWHANGMTRTGQPFQRTLDTLGPWSGVRPVGSKTPTRLGSARTAGRRWSGRPLLRRSAR